MVDLPTILISALASMLASLLLVSWRLPREHAILRQLAALESIRAHANELRRDLRQFQLRDGQPRDRATWEAGDAEVVSQFGAELPRLGGMRRRLVRRRLDRIFSHAFVDEVEVIGAQVDQLWVRMLLTNIRFDYLFQDAFTDGPTSSSARRLEGELAKLGKGR